MTVQGIPRAIAALERRKVQAQVADPIAARAGGQIVANVEREMAPKRTGRLASSIVVEMDGDTCQVGATADYDRFVQRGTRYMSAQAYGDQAAAVAAPGVAAAMAAIYKIAMR